MGDVTRVSDLDIDQDLSFQQRDWQAQRIGWGAMLLVVVAGLLGLLGDGPLSKASAGGQGDPVRLQFDRFARYGAPTVLTVDLRPGGTPEKKVRLWLDRDYVHGVKIERINPEPETAEVGADRVTYVFALSDRSHPATVTFNIQPEKRWSRTGRIGLADAPGVSFTQFVHP
jgi:hypothetical protein